MMRSRLFLMCMVLSEGTFIPFLCMNPELNFGEGAVLSQQVTCGNQEQVNRCKNAKRRSSNRYQGNGISNGPGNHWCSDYRCIFQVRGKLGFIIFQRATDLAGQHNGQGLIAGNGSCKEGYQKNSGERRNLFTELDNEVLNIIQESSTVKHTGKTGRNADNAYNVEHGNQSAATHDLSQVGISRMETGGKEVAE